MKFENLNSKPIALEASRVNCCHFAETSRFTIPCYHDDYNGLHSRSLTEKLSSGFTNQVLSASKIRELILSQGTSEYNDEWNVSNLDDGIPIRRIIIHGAVIQGRLDLNNIESNVPITLVACLIPSGISATRSRLSSLLFENCQIGSNWSDRSQATLNFEDSTISGGIYCPGTSITNHRGSALNLDGVNIVNNVRLHKDFHAIGNGGSATVSLMGTIIGGQLDLTDSIITNSFGPAISADRMQLGSSAFFCGVYKSPGKFSLGTIRLLGAKITGQVNFIRSKIENSKGPAIVADRVTILDSVSFSDDTIITGVGDQGAIRLPGATIKGQISMYGITSRNNSGRVKIYNASGPAIFADNLEVELNFVLKQGVEISARSEKGALQIDNARIGSILEITNSCIVNEIGPAVRAINLKVESNLRITDCTDMNDHANHQSIQVDGASVDGNFELVTNLYKNSNTTLLQATNMHVGQDMKIELSVKSNPERSFLFIDLKNTCVDGNLTISDSCISASSDGALWSIEGLTYAGCPQITGNFLDDAKRWGIFITQSEFKYSAQPFRYFAAQLIASGHYAEAHKILIKQRRKRAQLMKNPFRKLIDWILFVSIGYGYRTWLAFIYLLCLLIIALISINFVGNGNSVTVPSGYASSVKTSQDSRDTENIQFADASSAEFLPLQTQSQNELITSSNRINQSADVHVRPEACTGKQKFLLSIDTAIPLIPTGISDSCKILYGTTDGDNLGIIILGIKFFAWGLTALFITGFTGIVRKE